MSNNWPNYPIPANMEGTRRGNPYSRWSPYRDMRYTASQVVYGLTPSIFQAADQMTGGRAEQGLAAGMGGMRGYNQAQDNAHMRGLMRNDPGNKGLLSSLRSNWQSLVDRFRGALSRDGADAGTEAPVPQEAPPPPQAPLPSNQSSGSRGFDPRAGITPPRLSSNQQAGGGARSFMTGRNPFGGTLHGAAAQDFVRGMQDSLRQQGERQYVDAQM